MDTLVGIYKSKVIWVWRNLLSFVPGRWLLPGPARLNVILQSQQSITWLNVELTVPNCRIDKNFSTHLYRPWHKIFFLPFLMVSSYQERIGTGYESSCFCMAWWWSPDLRMTLQRGFAWTHRFFDVIFIWTIESDISVVKATAQFYLPLGIPHTTYYSTHHSSSKSSLEDGQQSCYSQLCV